MFWTTVAAFTLLATAVMPVFAGTVVSQTSGLWSNTATWGGTVPGAADDVFIAAGHTVMMSNYPLLTVNSLSVSGVLTHAKQTVLDSTPRYRINLRVTGDLTVPAGGLITADSAGYRGGYGPGGCPGLTTGRRTGGSHGGVGGKGSTTPATTYDSVIAPTNLGSGGCGYNDYVTYGGGAVLLNVGRTTRLDGVITANGTNQFQTANSGGSGGSVYLTTSNLLGTGLIQANGGNSTNDGANFCGGGGGGRIAVVLTGSEGFDSVSLHAFGGTNLASSQSAYSGGGGRSTCRPSIRGRMGGR